MPDERSALEIVNSTLRIQERNFAILCVGFFLGLINFANSFFVDVGTEIYRLISVFIVFTCAYQIFKLYQRRKEVRIHQKIIKALLHDR